MIRRLTRIATVLVTLLAISGLIAPPVAAQVRHIELEGAVNVRDLGGYRTHDGGRVRYGRAFRGDSLGELTEADVGRLGELGLTRVVDFRTPGEVRFLGEDRLPPGVVPVARPIDDTGLFEQMFAAISSRDPERQEELLGGGRAEKIMRNVYRSFLNEDSRKRFAETIRELADGRPMLYHCTAGKDRSGWLSYVVLRMVGVPESAARRDYLLSNDFRRESDAKLREGLKQGGIMENPDLLIPLQEVRDEYLNVILGEVEREYGGFGRFLVRGLELDARTIVKLRHALVGEMSYS